MSEPKYKVGHQFKLEEGGLVSEVIAIIPPHQVIEQLEYQPQYRVVVKGITYPEVTVGEDTIDKAITVAEEARETEEVVDYKYPVGFTFRDHSEPKRWYRLVSQHTTGHGTPYYIAESNGSERATNISENNIVEDKIVEVDWETGLAEDELRVKNLRLGDKFYTRGGKIGWRVESLGPISVQSKRYGFDDKTEVKAYVIDGIERYKVKNTFEFDSMDVVHGKEN